MHADLILHGGALRTMDGACPMAEAVAIEGGRIVAVGRDDAVLALAGAGTERVNLEGRTVLPGLEDAHVHFCGYGLSLQRLDLSEAASLEDALARVRTAVASLAQGSWLQGGGWNHNVWPVKEQPSRYDLDAVAPDVPVALLSKDWHALWVNSAALRAAGICAGMPDPAGGRILRDVQGEPNGILVEGAQELITARVPEPGPDAMRRAAKRAMAEAARLGLTGVHAPEGPEAMAAMMSLDAEQALTLRVWHHLPLGQLDSAVALGLRTGFGNDWLRIGHVKMFADGALGSATAEMLEPYDGRPGAYGVVATETEALYEAVRKAAGAGLASAIHAIGDAANRRVLDVFERVAREGLGRGLRQRIEHVQLLAPEDLARLAQLGVIASMQPIHATQDMDMADRQWGARCRYAYAWGSLLRSGARLAFGTDCPIESLNPLPNLYAAVTRRRADNRPAAGWYPEERVPLQDALYAYTMGSAYAAGQEHNRGSLTPGKLADVVVLSRAIYEEEPEALLETQVDITIVGGRVVYRRG
ncbi:MAG: amidohydrolase [Anaerolineae bacterium]